MDKQSIDVDMASPDLSPVELQILQLLAEGDRTSEIAKRLSMSYRTVARTISDLKVKTGRQSVTELLNYYQTITYPGE